MIQVRPLASSLSLLFIIILDLSLTPTSRWLCPLCAQSHRRIAGMCRYHQMQLTSRNTRLMCPRSNSFFFLLFFPFFFPTLFRTSQAPPRPRPSSVSIRPSGTRRLRMPRPAASPSGSHPRPSMTAGSSSLTSSTRLTAAAHGRPYGCPSTCGPQAPSHPIPSSFLASSSSKEVGLT